MVWLNSAGGAQPLGTRVDTANVSGYAWSIWEGQQPTWKVISYVLTPGATSISNLDVRALIEDAVSRNEIDLRLTSSMSKPDLKSGRAARAWRRASSHSPPTRPDLGNAAPCAAPVRAVTAR
jgi:hypothetical protein